MKKTAVAIVGLASVALAAGEADAGTTAWMLVSTALVLLMTPALAFFYGGLVRQKNVLNTMMMSFSALGVVTILWAFVGYSIAYGKGNAFIGDLSMAFMRGIGLDGVMPALLDVAFQGTFAVITAALISGSLVGRMRFAPWLLFIALWSVFDYAVLAHWVWGPEGSAFLKDLGALDFAGGTVVHINAAIAGVVGVMVLGPRKDFGRLAFLPHNIPFVLLGAGLLWFGWFGFNGGSAYAADASAALAFTNTFLAPAATLVVWTLLELASHGRATAVGAATAAVVGLVAITPAAGFVGPMGAIWLGALAAFPSYYFILWRPKLGLDDALDVFGAHGIGGITGAILTGVFASEAWGGTAGLLEGNAAQLWIQIGAVLAAVALSAVVSLVLYKLVGAFMPLRAGAREEAVGIDAVCHGEEAYPVAEGAVLVLDGERTGGAA
ncbi:ammonium transporter [Oceanithermus sp.]|uniref:ammonium transporter n=1 Tax=Oceanithermus sp. TaxID=2268145 RepID=UPI0025D52453|nr:ammonium transporter [Oceanithermus sp.]